MRYYISDLHFGQEKIAKRRGFSSAEEMEAELLKRINEKVGKDDILIIGGDFCDPKGDIVAVLKKIKCPKKVFIIGNHDAYHLKNKKVKELCQEVVWQRLVLDGDKKAFVSHFPQAEWNGYYDDVYHVYGHTHAHMTGAGAYMSLLPKALNMSADVNDLTPQTLDELIQGKQKNTLTMEQLLDFATRRE